MTSDPPKSHWLYGLRQHVEAKPIVLIRIDENESAGLRDSKLGLNEFTLTKPHDYFSAVKTPAMCLIFETRAERGITDGKMAAAFIGIVSSCSAISTLDTRIKVKRSVQIAPDDEAGLLDLLGRTVHATVLEKKLNSPLPIIALSPKLSSEIANALAQIGSNKLAMRLVADSLVSPTRYRDFLAVQEDAVQTALKAFGLGSNDRAVEVELVGEQATALARIQLRADTFQENLLDENQTTYLQIVKTTPLIEDAAIERDARTVSGYKLTSNDLTGRALFKKGNEQLEVITANRRDLEHVFGVDLIYVNLTKQNVVMVQYKMLEPNRRQGQPTEWLYRPDDQMKSEIARMAKVAKQLTPAPLEYRLNPQVFYLKFVKRDASLSNGSFVVTIDHYQKLLEDPKCRGPRNAVRISYESLNGRYLRQGPFLDLVHSGYIGSHATTSEQLQILIDAVLDGNRAVIAAVQSHID